MTPEELDPYFDAIQEQVKPPVRPPARKAQPAHPSVPRPAKRSIALPEDEPKRSMPVPASLEQFKCSVCGLRTVGGPCQKHPKSSERVT